MKRELVWAFEVTARANPVRYLIESSDEDQSWNVYDPELRCIGLDLTNRDDAVLAMQLDAGKQGLFVDEDEAKEYARSISSKAK